MAIPDLRKEYTLGGLNEADLDPDPLRQFQKWFDQAVSAQVVEPNAMVLATADRAGKPSTRVVLLKGVDARGFSFFTNYDSRKGRELAENPRASLTFFWGELERQVCIAGTVTKLSREESAAYFKTRPRGSRLAAWASQQSAVVPSRQELEQRMEAAEARYPGDDVPLPQYWGGYALAPERIEFWQGRPSRLHDRLCYVKQSDGSWRVQRLSP
jgi:pyridoxamine 5'-phosphate oxidase